MMPDLNTIARTIYEAKKQDSWGNWQSEHRKAWPATRKELERARQLNQDVGIEFAFAQAKAVKELFEVFVSGFEGQSRHLSRSATSEKGDTKNG